MLVDSEPRPGQAQRTVDQPLRKPGQPDGAACQQRRRMTFAGAADAQHALTTVPQGCHAPCLHDVAVCATPR